MKRTILTITGPSGSGKTTLLNFLLIKNLVGTVPSHTTREPRPNEKDGVDYFFVSSEKFKTLDMVEHIQFGDNFYGLSKQALETSLEENDITAIIVDRRGAEKIKELFPDNVVSMYINIDKKRAFLRLGRRDGYHNARLRQIIDVDSDLYVCDDFYDIIVTSDNSKKKLFEQGESALVAMQAMTKWRVANVAL